MIYAALTQFKIRFNLRIFFLPNPYSQSFQSLQKKASLAQGKSMVGMTTVKNPLFVNFFYFPHPLPLILTYPIILCIKKNLQKNRHNFHKKLQNKLIWRDQFCHGCFTSNFLINSMIDLPILFILCVTCHMSFVWCQHFSGRSGINEACPFYFFYFFIFYLNIIGLVTHIFETSCLLSFSGKCRVPNNLRT